MEKKRTYTPTTLDEYKKIVENNATIIKNLDSYADTYALKELQILEKSAYEDEKSTDAEAARSLEMQRLITVDVLHILDAIDDCGFSNSVVGNAIGLLNRLVEYKPLSMVNPEDFKEIPQDSHWYNHVERGLANVMCDRVSPPLFGTRLENGTVTDVYLPQSLTVSPAYHAGFIMGGSGRGKFVIEKAFELPTSSHVNLGDAPIAPNAIRQKYEHISVFQNYLHDILGDLFPMLDTSPLPRNVNESFDNAAAYAIIKKRCVNTKEIRKIVFDVSTQAITFCEENGDVVFHLQLPGTYNGEHDIEEGINFIRNMTGARSKWLYAIIDIPAEVARYTDRYGGNVSMFVPIAVPYDYRDGDSMFNKGMLTKLLDMSKEAVSIDFTKTSVYVIVSDALYNISADCWEYGFFDTPTARAQSHLSDTEWMMRARVIKGKCPWAENLIEISRSAHEKFEILRDGFERQIAMLRAQDAHLPTDGLEVSMPDGE